MIRCKKCNIEKDDECFTLLKSGGRRLTCKSCKNMTIDPVKNRERVKQWKNDNKEKRKLAAKRYRIKKRVERPWEVAMKTMLNRKAHRIFIEDSEYSYQEFKEHIEKQFDENMSWDNWGTYWDVDHKTPRIRFSYEDRYECHKLSNLQPLKKEINRYVKRISDELGHL